LIGIALIALIGFSFGKSFAEGKNQRNRRSSFNQRFFLIFSN